MALLYVSCVNHPTCGSTIQGSMMYALFTRCH